ncbi:MAG TPA: Zn-ribbon domain-containing OB-fold protein [Methanocorpusculum sp.]|nr:Zn-ribbon domain-containing OB-fold protein [Methanocorpusculum sp.]
MTVARFWRAINQRYNLIGTKCETCGSVFLPSRNICPHCRRKGKIIPYKCSGNGKIITYTVVHSTSVQYSMMKPYVLAIIELDEGARLTSQIVCDDINKIHIGMRVHSVFRVLGTDGPDGIIHYGTKFMPDDPV